MQKLKIFFLSLILIFAISTGVRAEFFSDVIVTSPNGIWTDSRSYTTLNDAVTAVGTVNQRTIVIASPQTVTALTVPSNITLKFERDGAIVNSGQLTINTKNIISDGHKIFAGLGDIDFASGTVVKLSWFHDLWNALTMTSDDHVTMVIDKAINATASVAVGNDVTLRWEAPNIITANAGVTVSNIGQIEAGSYQILAGAGNFRFRDGVSLNLEWFPYLRMALTWIDTTDATIVVNESSDVDYSDSVPLNIQLKINNGGALDIAPGVTLTIANNKQLDIGPCLFDPFTGTGSVAITDGTTYTPATTLTATALCTLSIDPIITNYDYEVDALMSYGDGTAYTNATILSALTAIGTSTEATVVLRPGTWVFSTNIDWSAYTNITLKFAPGAYLSHGAYTINWGGAIDALPTQRIFSGTGLITYKGVKYPEWYGAKDDSGTTDNTDSINAALAAGGEVELTAPNGGYYGITDSLVISVAGTRIYSHNKAEIKQATSKEDGFQITASNVEINNIKLTGNQYTTAPGEWSEIAIYPHGADSSNYISNIKIINCDMNTWGFAGVWMQFVEDFEIISNRIENINYAGILGMSVQRGLVSNNYVNNIVNTHLAYGIEWTKWGDDSLVTHPRSSDINTVNNEVRNVTYWKGIGTHGGERLTFTGNNIYGCYVGLGIGGATDGDGDAMIAPLSVSVSGGTIDSGVTDGTASFGLFFAGAEGVQLATGSVSGVTIKGYGDEDNSGGTAVYIHSTSGLTVSGVSVINAGRTGITAYKLNRGLTITGCSLYGVWSDTYHPIGISVNGAAATIDAVSYDSSVFIDGNSFIKGEGSATYEFDSASARAIYVASTAGNYARIGKNNTENVTQYVYDAGNYATRLTTVPVESSGTGEDTLASFTIPAGTIGIGGGIRITAAGTKTGSNGNKTLKLYFGTSSVTFNAAANDTNDWRVQAELFNSATNAQRMTWLGHNGATPLQGYDALAIDTTAAVTVKVTGECADAGDTITQMMFYIERL